MLFSSALNFGGKTIPESSLYNHLKVTYKVSKDSKAIITIPENERRYEIFGSANDNLAL